MGSRTKTPDCQCVACQRFLADSEQLLAATRRIGHYLSANAYDKVRKFLDANKGCDLCGRDAQRAAHVPQVVKDFFRIEYLCEWCRNRINYQRRSLKWPICWGSTPDDELKWFLLHDALERFNIEVQKLSPAGVARQRAHDEWLASLPKFEQPPPVELKITIRRRTPPASAESAL